MNKEQANNSTCDWKAWGKRMLPDITCVLLFVAIAVFYFMPALEGKKLTAGDHSQMDGVSVEVNSYREAHNGETPRWINSIFSGMPTYQISPSYDSQTTLKAAEKAYHLWLPEYVWYIFASMLGFYILLRAFDFRQWMAALGAIVWAFSSYFFIIIAAGHIWKVITLTYIPPTIAGMVLCYKGRYLWGGIVTAIFAALQLSANHIQMSYYFLLPEIAIALSFLVEAIRKKCQLRFWKATGAIAAAAVIAVALNLSNLYHTYEYAKQARGGSELVKADKQDDQTQGGLDRSYITNWSYGIDETMTFLIPNFRGGASQDVFYNVKDYAYHYDSFEDKADSVPAVFDIYISGQKYTLTRENVFAAMGEYWGEQPMTSGPVYVGALVCMLFLLALLIIPHNNVLKWALLAVTLLTVVISWGHNFPAVSNFFIDYVPMFSKFRPISSILVVAEFTIPLLALLGLKEFVQGCSDEARRPQLLRSLYISAGVTLGICFLFAVVPSLGGNGLASHDHDVFVSRLTAYFGASPEQAEGLAPAFLSSIADMRLSMLSSDAWRSFFFIAVGFVALFWFFKKKVVNTKQVSILSAVLLAVCLIDMWGVNKRYINDGMFSTPEVQLTPDESEADKMILSVSGSGRNYRVFDQQHFGDNTTAFRYSSIGGYHAAKLLRYQELLDAMGQNPEMYNMLNVQWFKGVHPQTRQEIAQPNPDAYGNAWLVDTILYVNNANEELETLNRVSPRHTAVVDKRFEGILGKDAVPAISAGDTIVQTELTSTTVKYKVSSKKGALAVFSEIYYPDWTATMDGKPVEIGRADYVLRAMRIPAGDHTIEMTFDPQSIKTTETIAYIAYILLLLGILAGIYFAWRKMKSQGLKSAATCAMYFVLCTSPFALSSCGNGNKPSDAAASADSVGAAVPLTHFADSVSESYKSHVAQFTLIADVPADSDSLSVAVCRWVSSLMAREGECFEGTPTDLPAMFKFYSSLFCQQNSAAHIKEQIDMLLEMAKMEHPEGVDSIEPTATPEWEYRFWVKKEFENDRIISFTGNAYLYGVENATSNANCSDATFLKSNGRMLGFDLFTSVDALRPLVEAALVKKYGQEEVDLYELGIPMPNAPLFMADGVRFDYSDYQIIESHYFETHGEFPCCFVPYTSLSSVLTPEGKQLLGL